MVVFILSKNGFLEIEPLLIKKKPPMWLSGDILSKKEQLEYINSGWDISVFDHQVSPVDKKQFKDDIKTIKLHHPNQNIWTQL